MKGAIVFIITFAIFLAATLAYPELPVGKTISDSIGIDPTVEWSSSDNTDSSNIQRRGLWYNNMANLHCITES